MLHVYIGTDTVKARSALQAALLKHKGAMIIRITDAHTIADLEQSLKGEGLFGGKRVVVLENVFSNDAMAASLYPQLKDLGEREDDTYIYQNETTAELRKTLEKYAEHTARFDAPKKEKKGNFFAIANALQSGKKKDLWVILQREYAAGISPEQVHGSLFWAAKQMVLKPRSEAARTRGAQLVAELAELPHEARRNGFDLEYALEQFVLARV